MLSDSIILKKIQRQPKQAAAYKQLVRELGLHGDQRKELSGRLQKMISAGQLVKMDSDRYAIPQAAAAASKNLIAGKLSLHRDGFGFVIPDLASASPNLKGRLAGDIFIPPHAVGSAMHGDQVLVEVTNVRDGGKAEGRILRPVHRVHATVVGIFHYGARNNYVVPLDQKISQQIVIPHGMEYPEEAPAVVRRASSGAMDAALTRGGTHEVTPSRGDKRAGRNTGDGRRTTSSKHRVLGEEASRRSEWSDLENV